LKQAQSAIEGLNKSLVRRAADLEAANRELESFSYSVSHDLRAPLRSIDGFSRILEEDCAAKLSGDDRHHLQRIRANTQRMAHLIDGLLNLARLSRAELHLENVDLSALAREVVAELRRAEPERLCDFAVEPGLIAWGDPQLLRVMLTNLLGNAWKFTAKRSLARIDFGRAPEGGAVSFAVRDNGAGFDMAAAAKLFGAFQRLHDVADFPGTGIGLATVQRIVHRHGGRVWAQGHPNQGATFSFTLPLPSNGL